MHVMSMQIICGRSREQRARAQSPYLKLCLSSTCRGTWQDYCRDTVRPSLGGAAPGFVRAPQGPNPSTKAATFMVLRIFCSVSAWGQRLGQLKSSSNTAAVY